MQKCVYIYVQFFFVVHRLYNVEIVNCSNYLLLFGNIDNKEDNN